MKKQKKLLLIKNLSTSTNYKRIVTINLSKNSFLLGGVYLAAEIILILSFTKYFYT